ncbi:hypothetical protein [Plasticicumulans acidivorans]|uniref:Uncharacterized protein n=1 Tax=Plasticicumulans acidivorans TaxID=886464 RepID=A0A317MV39_9GAMM|nr:hypothetical protein [Plasticicumulans acidivorans]PWV61634.1 hypothetical protein C7443_10562 [Plasticicumulans acidivorans]
MADILPFKRPKPADRMDAAAGKELCKSGFHKWEVLKERQFDVKLGKLVTAYRCKRCGATKTEAR